MLRRRYRSLSPLACSAKVTAGQPGFRQRNRRTCKTISTGLLARRAVGHRAPVPAVHLRRRLTAPRTARRAGLARRGDHHRLSGVFDPVHAQPRQVREQHGQQGLPLLRDIPDDAGGRADRPGRQHDRLIRQRGSRVQ